MYRKTYPTRTGGMRMEARRVGSELRQDAWTRHRPLALLWIGGFSVLMIVSIIIHFHPGPYPVDLQATIDEQHLQMWPWVRSFLNFVSLLNDPIPSLIEAGVWLVIFWAFRRFVEGVIIAAGLAAADGIDGLLSTIVGRPRPSSPLIHIYIHEPFHSFPSGHTEHDTVYYGFLLFLSLLKPVRTWRYHWILLPFQIFAVVALISIGYSRVLEGAHWVTDVLAGYLSGALLLLLLLWLYGWGEPAWADWRARKRAQKARAHKNKV